ncbi:MAG TPA: tetratricopeptide repeat protein [Polyangiales bacterium]
MVRASAPPPTDEYTLLWQARTRLKRDPAGALAILEENAERFERMQLAPEREVLAVEALRALGRKDEADRRLRAFRARYPGSIHLRRLQQGQ